MNTVPLLLQITRLEATHLGDLIDQFAELLTDDASDDPAVLRLVPDAYTDDPEAAREFRDVTERDLLRRRRRDAQLVRTSLSPAATLSSVATAGAEGREEVDLVLDPDTVQAWLRTLAAVRLVIASRLGITDEDQHDDDPRFGVYDWLGYRLEGLIRAIEAAGTADR
ncbi:DUF2017 family protein [Microbacterium sp. ET2]|uniref:DUF2017 family protein n=1 Tax=Microbacterium albipurpureum TaxID=3050384 RepID=UPI00259C8E48|nr:DUF2017 family protein [Microbacterium sp. ET2 (Ac-2212)]WJL95738.1 DUF2017 family protein [Microbacterium sp. ET2 (Ac-2212)]